MHLAVARSQDIIISRKLLRQGGDICSRSAEGKTPLHTFFRETNRELLACCHDDVESTLTDDQGMHLLHYLAWSSKSQVSDLQPFLTEGSDVFTRDHRGRSMLFFAAERGNTAILEHFLGSGEQPNWADADCDGLSLMHYAVRSARIQTIDVLHNHGYCALTSDKNMQNALHHAVRRSNLEATKRLLFLYGRTLLDAVDSNGRTPLNLAQDAHDSAALSHMKTFLPLEDAALNSSMESDVKPHGKPDWSHCFNGCLNGLDSWQILVSIFVMVFGTHLIYPYLRFLEIM